MLAPAGTSIVDAHCVGKAHLNNFQTNNTIEALIHYDRDKYRLRIFPWLR